MRFYWLVLGILAVWRIVHLLVAEDGPADLLVRLRRKAGKGFWGSLLDCFYCLSLWISAPIACFIGDNWKERLLLWPALSGGAILLERMTLREEQPPPPAFYVEDKEEENVLWKEQSNVSGSRTQSPTH